MIIRSQHINKMNNLEAAAINSPSSQLVRLEWITEVGGTYLESQRVFEGATLTTNVLDNIPAIWGPVQRDQREKTRIFDQTISIDQQAYWYFDNAQNLSYLDKLMILQRVMDLLFSGDGTAAAAVWTPDAVQAWIVNQWKGYWLVFPTTRFKILSNDATSVTVDLDGGTLPVGSTAGEILTFVKWRAVKDDLSNPGGSMSPLGQEGIFQSVLCTRLGTVGV